MVDPRSVTSHATNEAHPAAVHLSDYRPPPYFVDRADLCFELGEETTEVRASLKIRRNPHFSPSPAPLRLDAEELELIELSLDGQPLDVTVHRLEGGAVQIATVPDQCIVETVSRLRPAENRALNGLYQSGGMFCTQCEAEGFRRITPYPDRPDVLAPFTTTIIARRDAYPVLLSNGDCIEAGALEDERHYTKWSDPHPKPSYLFALVAGDLSCQHGRFTTASGRTVDLSLYTEPSNRGKTDHALASLQRAMRWDEQAYGLEYDLDTYIVVAVNDFNMGAMENKGLNIFNTQYVLATPDTATDSDFENVEAVIGHEYFHNWTGNRVTCRDWFQLSLKEGLTVFREHQFAEAMGSPAVQRIQQVRTLRNSQFPEDAGPLAHPVRPDSYIEINNFYTATVYDKGAEVIRMYRVLLGEDAFRRGVRLYLERHDGQAATIEDFLCAMEDAGATDLSQFARWYCQAGTPRLRVSDEHDPETGVYTLHVSQRTPPTPGQAEKPPLHIPLAIGLLDAEGRELPPRLVEDPVDEDSCSATRILEVKAAEQSYRFTGCFERPRPSLLRGFSAPVKLECSYSDDDLAFLLAHDTDPFARWEAGQQLAVRILLDKAAGHRRTGGLDLLQEGFRHSLERIVDPALTAEALTLPSEIYLAEQVDEVDPEALHSAREGVRRHLGQSLRELWLTVYHKCSTTGPWRFEPENVARRRLRNLALAYLIGFDPAEGAGHAVRQLERADNMTDRYGALSCLADTERPEADEALKAFHLQWRHEPLVLDKWFRVQALSLREDTPERVRTLLAHEDFTLENPNRVRSVLGVYSRGNPARFHAPDGGGYTLLTDQVLELDAFNPQLAARLAGSLTQWRRYEPIRKNLMRRQLERIMEKDSLSKDVYEVASKSLEGA